MINRYIYIQLSGYGHYIDNIKFFESLDEAEKYAQKKKFTETGHNFFDYDRLYFPKPEINKTDRSKWCFIYKLGKKK